MRRSLSGPTLLLSRWWTDSMRGISEGANVVVVGGGPGGSTLATLVAMRGHHVVLLEKEKFPRWQIGESLLPSTVHGICRLTGVADELAKAGFTKKRGGTQRWGANPEPWTFAFSVSPKMTGETSFAYQVERSKFDQILLDHARHMGVRRPRGTIITDRGSPPTPRPADLHGPGRARSTRTALVTLGQQDHMCWTSGPRGRGGLGGVAPVLARLLGRHAPA